MCLTCGCMKPFENYGDSRNLVVDDITKSTMTNEASGMTPQQAVDNLVKTWNETVPDETKTNRIV